MLMLLWLHGEQLLNGYLLLAAPLIGLLPAGIAQQFWHRFPLYWQRLTLLLATVTASALLNTALLSPFVKSPAMMLGLASFTGGVLLTPFVYLIDRSGVVAILTTSSIFSLSLSGVMLSANITGGVCSVTNVWNSSTASRRT